MKIINKFFGIIFLIILSCKSNQINISETTDKGIFIIGNSFVYKNSPYLKFGKNSYFINQDLITNEEHIGGDNPSLHFKYHGTREGVIQFGIQEGKWLSSRYFHYDSLNHNKSKKYMFREEYFKRGLRDSIYKIYDKDGKVIYSTYFKNGTGTEKDFHKNGKLYYEIKTKDGYFTDTLKLYNDKGELFEKILYDKDSLVYKENIVIKQKLIEPSRLRSRDRKL